MVEFLDELEVGGEETASELAVEEENDSTLADVSTLRSELNSGARVTKTSVVTETDVLVSESLGGNEADGEDEDDDDYKTLKDVVELDHDDEEDASRAPVGRLSLLETLQLPLRAPELFGGDLEAVVEAYNGHFSGQGQETALESPDRVRGFLRVQMNLRRPINVISGTRPPSIYNITKEDTAGARKTLTTFYLPPDTVKALHVTSETTVIDVIRSLLAKFRVADNPHKYALYEKSEGGGGAGTTTATAGTLARVRMRRLRDAERPLVLALRWCRDGVLADRVLVLQENDPGEISWEAFSMPELKNFLLILDREEAWYKKKIHEKYEVVHDTMQALIEEKRREKKRASEEGEEANKDNSTKI